MSSSNFSSLFDSPGDPALQTALPRQCSQDIFRKKPLTYPLCEILAEEQPDEVENKESDQKTENQCHYDQEKTANDTDYQ